MLHLLKSLSEWLVGFADSPWAVAVLVINSFTESIFNPIPPDPLLIGMSILQPNSALLFAAMVTVASVAGAVVGHWLGQKLGRPIVLRFISAKKVDRVEGMFRRYGAWAVLIAAFTPIPYKVFAVTAGVLELDRRPFIIASIIGRGARFFLLAGLIFFFGEAIQEFIETRFELITLLSTAVLLVALVAVFFIIRWRQAKSAPALGAERSLESD